ncbi:MAG TPA: type II toxin-antitoxin system VapC family toxin [Gelria sp.]|nr:type II toxin-antitoxin system VapC family toxin [Gelria sp.]
MTSPTGRYLLDTNIIIALLASDESVKERLVSIEEVFLPSIAIGELYYGAYRSSRRDENIKRIDKLVKGNNILVCNARIAQEYGLIKSRLSEKGRPIPENDIWIAALASSNNLIVVTRDEHFKHVEGLQIEMW